MKIKYILGIVLFCIVAVLNVVTTINREKSIDFSTTSLLAISESGLNEKRYGYIDAQEECDITNIVDCTVDLMIPGIGFCNLGFSYTVTVKGTQNFCKYVGGKDVYCNFFTCRSNG